MAPPTKQAAKASRRNESVPHVGVPVGQLPHTVTGPIGPGGSGGLGDQFMAASVPTPAPSAVSVVDSAIETRKIARPNSRRFRALLVEEQERRRCLSAGSGAVGAGGGWSSSLSSSPMRRLATRDVSPRDVVAAFKAAFHVGGEQGAEEQEEEGGDYYWPEYIYSPGADTDCFLCGVRPLPSSSHLAPDGTRA